MFTITSTRIVGLIAAVCAASSPRRPSPRRARQVTVAWASVRKCHPSGRGRGVR